MARRKKPDLGTLASVTEDLRLLKSWLRTAGLQAQDEILIERTAVWLVEGRTDDAKRPT